MWLQLIFRNRFKYKLHTASVEKLKHDLTFNNVILCGYYNIPGVTWSFDDFDLIYSNITSPSAIIIADSFSFLNLFQWNTIPNFLNVMLILIFYDSKASTPLDSFLTIHHKDLLSLSYQRLYLPVNTPNITIFRILTIGMQLNLLNSLMKINVTFIQYNTNSATSVFNYAIYACIKQYIPLRLLKKI